MPPPEAAQESIARWMKCCAFSALRPDAPKSLTLNTRTCAVRFVKADTITMLSKKNNALIFIGSRPFKRIAEAVMMSEVTGNPSTPEGRWRESLQMRV